MDSNPYHVRYYFDVILSQKNSFKITGYLCLYNIKYIFIDFLYKKYNFYSTNKSSSKSMRITGSTFLRELLPDFKINS